MASIASIVPLYAVDSVTYTKEQIVEMHKKIQSDHDKTKSREFTPVELAVKEHYKTIQSARDSERIRALKTMSRSAPVVLQRTSEHSDNVVRIRNVLAQLSEAQIDFDDRNYSYEELARIREQFESARTALTNLRTAVSGTGVTSTRVPDDLRISGDLTIQIGDSWFNEDMILSEKAKIQSAHDKDKTLEFDEYELGILAEYKKIQSKRDSARIRARRLGAI